MNNNPSQDVAIRRMEEPLAPISFDKDEAYDKLILQLKSGLHDEVDRCLMSDLPVYSCWHCLGIEAWWEDGN